MTTAVRKQGAGFTLLELLFTMILFVMLVSLSVPLFSRTLRSLGRKTCVEDILALMEFARERAIMEQTDYGVHFDSRRKAYWLIRREDGEFQNGFSHVPSTWGRARPLPSDADLHGDEPDALFHPDGTATPFSLELASPEGSLFTFHVDPVLGKGSVIEQAS
jgi:type II secretory pathway pseudopilin PulG